MTTARTNAPQSASATADAAEVPWYDLIDDPEPPEDGMQQDDTIHDVMSILKARYHHDASVLLRLTGLWFSDWRPIPNG